MALVRFKMVGRVVDKVVEVEDLAGLAAAREAPEVLAVLVEEAQVGLVEDVAPVETVDAGQDVMVVAEMEEDEMAAVETAAVEMVAVEMVVVEAMAVQRRE